MPGKGVTFKDSSAEAKAGMLQEQYKALKEAASAALAAVRERAPKQRDKRLMYNLQARTYTRKKYGFVVAHIGILDKEHAKKVPRATFYAAQVELGTAHRPATPFLKPGIYENIDLIRQKLGEYLPGIAPANPDAPDEEETTDI
jgi:HK97 gp10 family phage protein